jgi:predicted nucleotidyltransferase
MDYQVELLAIIKKYIPNCTVYLFGSRARRKHHVGSDIDLAIDAHQVLDSGVIGNIKEEIEESTIPYFVDVIDFNDVSADMKEEILKDGIIWSS